MEYVPRVKKSPSKRCSKVKRLLINRHRLTQNKNLRNKLELLLLAEKPQSHDNSVSLNGNFQQGYLNAVNEVSRLLASIPDIDVEMGKTIMMHLGLVYNRMIQQPNMRVNAEDNERFNNNLAPSSPASSGYYSDCESNDNASLWRPW